MKVRLTLLFFLFSILLVSQNAAENLIPTNTITHEAISNGDWSNPNIWSTNSVPSAGAIVHIPSGITVTYDLEAAEHIFGIRVDGTFRVEQTDNTKTTRLKFDTMYGSPSSLIQYIANTTTDGQIEVTIEPFDIVTYKTTIITGDTAWNSNATNHYNDGLDVNQIEREITLGKRYRFHNDAVAAYNGQSPFNITSSTLYNDGIGVTGRYEWDPMQMSIGIIIRGELEIIGREKTTYVQLAQDALRQQKKVVLSSEPTNWNSSDDILLTKSGKLDAAQNATEVSILDTYDSPTTLSMVLNLTKNHEGTPDPDFTLHCYAGNLTRNIVFKSGSTTNIHHRAHLMVMHTNTNIQIKNAQFKNMGRTDKSRWVDDLLFDEWTEPEVFKSYSSALGQNAANAYRPNAQDITNHRGRYSIHLHENGARLGDNMIQVTGNVVWGNPGWGITHHDAHANISDNVVYDVLGAGIVSETGSETGFWDNNLVVDIERRIGSGDAIDPYIGALFYNDYLYRGIGLGMKGRAVVCNDNVIADAYFGVRIMNLNPNSGTVDKVDPLQLSTIRPNFQIDHFPLSTNGYSKEGDDVMPVEVALIMNNTTIMNSPFAFNSIERDMGVNHESRSVFDGLIIWGTQQGINNVYQVNYTFIDTFISGRSSNTSSPSRGLFMWKHSFNHVYDNIKFRDLDYAIVPSKLVLSDSGEYKTRNNGFTPWIFIDAKTDNIGNFYRIIDEDDVANPIYTEHADNPIFFASTDVNTNRDITFTMLDEASTGLPYYEIPGDLQFPFGYIDYTEMDPDKQFAFAIDGVITDQLGAYKFGIEQAPAQGTLRNGYPERLYQFASEAKFIEYLTANGLYEDPTDNSLYFIINELVPDRLTLEYKSFPLRIKISNPPSTGIFASPQIEANFGCAAEDQLISRFATVSQSSTQTGEFYTFDGQNLAIDPNASKAVDGNTNARDNAQYLQRFDTTGVTVGTYALTQLENQPWYDLDFGDTAEITYIDIWNTVTLNGEAIAPTNADLTDFYILLDNDPFTGKTLAQALTDANWSHHQTTPVGRKLSLDSEVAGNSGRYMRIQKAGNTTQLKLAEIEVLGKISEDQTAPVNTCPGDQTVEIGGSSAYTIPDYWLNGLATAVDNCTNPLTNFTQSPSAGTNVALGTYTITLTSIDDANNEATCTFELTVDNTLTVDDTLNIDTVFIAPNPANSTITIYNLNHILLKKLSIYDLTGRQVFTETLDRSTNINLDVSMLQASFYMLIIEDDYGNLKNELIVKN